ncbi:protein folded gastrulation [Anopheles moucheti]|uniref:protein folded gastrulation n=1 Tax=Anopheles moucheti TaxID=186751 RepID=UPI0022F04FAC|nr:protein folded gastrulation [Anopheles moucheti]XP_052901983.1 protein folded gastrulation [Anopheles moucheti]
MKHKTITLTRRKMELCCWCLLLAVLATDALPITSKPLDNNPDHLTWEAAWLSEDNRASMPLGGKSKKITPKSIFITPFLNSYNTSSCPPDYKVDYNGKCIQVVSINTADILVTKLQSLFSQHGDGGNNGGGTGEDDYDYDYDSTGPFHVNLPLSIDLPPEPPQPPIGQATSNLTYQDIPQPSFYDSAMVEIATVDQDKAKITTVSVSDPENPSSSVKPFLATSTPSTPEPAQVDHRLADSTHSNISFLAFETLPNGTLVGQVELEGKNSTMVQSIFVSSTTTAIPMADSGSTAESTVIELASNTGTTTNRDADTTFADGDAVTSTVLFTQDMLTTTTVQGDGIGNNHTEKEEDDSIITTTDVSSMNATTTTEQNELDLERMNLEMEEELLLVDSHRSSPSPSALSTTNVFEIEPNILPTVEMVPSDEPKIVSKDPEPVTVSTTFPPPIHAYVAIPTNPSVQIITPIKGNWDLGIKSGSAHPIAASHPILHDRTTRATPETTTLAINVERSTQKPTDQTVQQDSLDDRENNEGVGRQEAQHAMRGVSGASNSVVHYHFPVSTLASTNELSVSSLEFEITTANSILQVLPIASTPPGSNNKNYLEQLRKINEIVAEKRRHQQLQEHHFGAGSSSTRIRFPSQDEEQMSSAASNNFPQKASGVRFPGTATNRFTPSSSIRLPDIFPKKSPDTTTQRPAFWWLPSGWEVDQTGNKPMLLRFWSRMPLVRDSALQSTSSSNTGNVNHDPIDTSTETSNNRWRSATGFYQQQQATGTSHPLATARGNSKSPTENFYKEVSAQEVYKVMNARQLNHNHQR